MYTGDKLAIVSKYRLELNPVTFIAAGLVTPVSTGALFPSPVACLALPISAVAWWTLTEAPKHTGGMLKLARWLQTVQKNSSESFSNNFLFYQANDYSLTSLICKGCGLRD